MAGQILITTKKKVLTLPTIYRYVLKLIFDRDNFTREEGHEMENSIEAWKQHFDLHEMSGHFHGNPALVWEKDQLVMMCNMLVRDERGGFEKQKELYKEHGLDYKKCFRLKESYTYSDLAKANVMYREYAKKHPEQEAGIII